MPNNGTQSEEDSCRERNRGGEHQRADVNRIPRPVRGRRANAAAKRQSAPGKEEARGPADSARNRLSVRSCCATARELRPARPEPPSLSGARPPRPAEGWRRSRKRSAAPGRPRRGASRGRTNGRRHLLRQGNRRDSLVPIILGIQSRQVRRHYVQLCLRLRQLHSGLSLATTRSGCVPRCSFCGSSAIGTQMSAGCAPENPTRVARELKIRRQHADHRVTVVVQRDLPSRNIPVRAEPLLPNPRGSESLRGPVRAGPPPEENCGRA